MIVGVLAIGVPVAWLTSCCEFPGRRILEAALILPLAAPAYVLAYAYAGFLSAYGPVQVALQSATGLEPGQYWFPEVRSLPGAALMLTLVLYPYVYLLARARFLSESATAREAARLLGRGPWASFFEVSLPLARPAIVAGATLAAMEAFADYGTVAYFGVPAFTTGIYNAWFSFADPRAAAQLASILIGFVALALLLERFARGKARFHETGRRDARPPRFHLKGGTSVAAIAACALPPLLGFVVPALVLIELLIASGGPTRDFDRHLFNSLMLCGRRCHRGDGGRAAACLCAQGTAEGARRKSGVVREPRLCGAGIGSGRRRADALRRVRQHDLVAVRTNVRRSDRPRADGRDRGADLRLHGALSCGGAAKRRRRASNA